MAGYTVVSAPGKVLVAGGYLVLDPAYSALVVATSSRFYCSVRNASSSSTATDGAVISVRAGQFPKEASTWVYGLRSTSNSLALELNQLNEEDGRNKFIEIALSKAIQVALEVIATEVGENQAVEVLLERIKGSRGAASGELEVVVLADNDFYSQREQLAAANLPALYSSLDSLKPFTPLPRPLSQTNKTGLGSSAALVTSLIAAILSHLNIVSIPTTQQSEEIHLLPTSTDLSAPSSSDPSTLSSSHLPNEADVSLRESQTKSPTAAKKEPVDHLALVHNLSQLAHCLAQGKVGSGFDVSSAVYGSHTYTRFSPSILHPLMTDSTRTITQTGLLSALAPESWDHKTRPFRLPKGLRLMLADVDAGTDTPSFVGKVLKWREANRVEADTLWGALSKANLELSELLVELSVLEGQEGYQDELNAAAEQPIEKCDPARPISRLLLRIQASLTTIRKHLQTMSRQSAVPIEPDEQTRLLDACSALPGVLGGGVPGAGGYDAIYLLTIDTPDVISRVEGIWAGWTEMSVCPLSSRQSDGGLRLENLDGVRGLRTRLGW